MCHLSAIVDCSQSFVVRGLNKGVMMH